MANEESRRETVIKNVIDIFIDVAGFLSEDEKKQVNKNTHIIKSFNVDGDATEIDIALEKRIFNKTESRGME